MWKMSVFGAFLVRFFPAFGVNMELYRVGPRIHSECGEIRVRSTPNGNNFHAMDVRALLLYFGIIAL